MTPVHIILKYIREKATNINYKVVSKNDDHQKCTLKITLIQKQSPKNNKNKHSHLPCYKRKLLKDKTELCCIICQNTIKPNHVIRNLPLCNHIFHKRCIDKWFKQDKKNMKCPICRKKHTRKHCAHSTHCTRNHLLQT